MQGESWRARVYELKGGRNEEFEREGGEETSIAKKSFYFSRAEKGMISKFTSPGHANRGPERNSTEKGFACSNRGYRI